MIPTLGLSLVAVVWVGWQLGQLGVSLRDLRTVATQVQRDAQSRDTAALVADLRTARDDANKAAVAADAPGVVVAAALPLIGDDVTVVRELAHSAADIGASTTDADPLLEKLARDNPRAVLADPSAREVVARVRTATDAAAERLNRLDLSGLQIPVGDEVAKLRNSLTSFGPTLDTLNPYLNASALLSTSAKPHTWLVVMQNLSESRPSGGIIGGWLVIRADGGELKVLAQGSNDALGAKVHYQGYLPSGYEQVFGDSMSDWRTVNMAASFPQNARLFAHAWNSRGGQRVDGVLALGQGSVRFLAAATGSVTVDGRSIAPAALADYLQVGIYQDFPDPKAKDAALAGIVAQVLGKLSKGQLNLPSLLAAANGGASADYLQLWSSDRATQQRIEAGGLSGAFGDVPGPVASVRLADAAANKLDAFVHLSAEYRLGECVRDEDGVASRSSTFTVTLRNAVPEGLPTYMTGEGELLDGRKHPTGATRDFVIVYTPTHATVTSALFKGQPAVVQSAWVGERQMLVFDVQLDPGQSGTIVLNWDELPTDSQDRPFPRTPQIVLQPLANRAEVHTMDGSACVG